MVIKHLLVSNHSLQETCQTNVCLPGLCCRFHSDTFLLAFSAEVIIYIQIWLHWTLAVIWNGPAHKTRNLYEKLTLYDLDWFVRVTEFPSVLYFIKFVTRSVCVLSWIVCNVSPCRQFCPLLQTLCRALILLRNKNLLTPTDLLSLFFHLLRCHDKALRKFLETHIINDIKNMNAKHKNVRLNTVIT